MSFFRRVLAGLLVLTAIAAVAPAAVARDYGTVVAPQPPPVHHKETRPPPPGPEDQWMWDPGHWRWDGYTFAWVSGHWMERRSPDAEWVPGHWGPHDGGWVWVQGHWR